MAIESTVTMNLEDYERIKKQIANQEVTIATLRKEIEDLQTSGPTEIYRKFLKSVLIDPRQRSYIPINRGGDGPLHSMSYHTGLIEFLANEAGATIHHGNEFELPQLKKY